MDDHGRYFGFGELVDRPEPLVGEPVRVAPGGFKSRPPETEIDVFRLEDGSIDAAGLPGRAVRHRAKPRPYRLLCALRRTSGAAQLKQRMGLCRDLAS